MVTAFKTAASDGNDQVPAGEYTITINKSAKDDSTATTLTAPAETTQTTVESVIESYAGSDWKNTKLKSSKWTNADGSVRSEIHATIKVENDGSVNVTYTPTTIKDQTNK